MRKRDIKAAKKAKVKTERFETQPLVVSRPTSKVKASDRWTEDEKTRFNEAFCKNGSDFDKISAYVGTKDKQSIRNRAYRLEKKLKKKESNSTE